MKKEYKIDACHPIFKRVIETRLDQTSMENLYDELKESGYDSIEVDLTRVVYEEGDFIEVDVTAFECLPDNPDEELEVVTIKDRQLADCKRTIKYIYGDRPDYIVGELKAHRLGRDHGHLSIEWVNPKNPEWANTNVYFLEAMGFEFEHPEFKVIPMRECDDNLLGDHERVIKYLMLQYPEDYLDEAGLEKEIDEYMKPLLNAMNKAGCVFYRP